MKIDLGNFQMDLIKNLQWIPCEEGLPNFEGEFLICGVHPTTNRKYVTHATTKEKKDKITWNWRGYKTVCMTHWANLPEPPK